MVKWISLIALLFLSACSIDDSSSVRTYNASAESDSLHEDMIRMVAENSFVVLGSDKSSYLYTERPAMTARFDYNFSIGKHEVTNEEFSQFATEDWGGFSKSGKSNYPVSNLTYYDAVLYANARSKAEGYDTAYTYKRITVDESGNCSKMEGLTFHPEVDAYRLPTEAEWMLAAAQDWNLDKAWTMENSQGDLHPVCSAGENRLGLCDIAGNVAEWVNDWKGSFKDTVVFNYGGAPDGSLSGERVVKGGYYKTQRKSTNFISRGDVYVITSSEKKYYVGFRIAFGRIPDITWLSGSGTSSSGRAVSQMMGTTVRSKLGTIQTKLAFRNAVSGNISFIDYAITANSVFEIRDTLDCYHPDISPDGAFVAFSTGMEGPDMESSVYVRILNIAGDSLVKLDVENASIPRWRVQGTDTSIVYVTSAGNNSSESKFKSQSTWEVPFRNFKFGTPKKLFDGAYHGGVSPDYRLAVTGNSLLRARMADSEAVWYNGVQACNASLAADSTKRTLFLDFGNDSDSSFVGKSYDVHERLLIADSTGKLIQSVGAPKGYSFDHTEWATGGYTPSVLYKRNFAVASLTGSSGSHEKIVMIDLRDSSITEMVEGTELWHPCLWTFSPAIPTGPLYDSVDLDSAALYFENDGDRLIATKMNLFWTKSNFVKVVGLGSSRMSLGLVSNKMTYGATLNMAVIPSDMDVSHYMAVNYVLNHCPKLKYIVLGLDLDLWSDKMGVNVENNIENVPGFQYDVNHDFWTNGDSKVIVNLSKLYLNQSYALHNTSLHMGWVEEEEKNGWSKGGYGNDFMVSDSTWSNNSATYEASLERLQDIIDRAGEKNVKVLGVVFPQSPDYAKTGAFGRHGMRRSHATKILERIKKMESDNSNFFVLDENKMGKHDYPDSTAYDYDHLNMFGGDLLTSRIDSAIIAIEGKK